MFNKHDELQSAGGVNNFLPLTLNIEGQEYQWANQYITGKELRELAGLPGDVDLYLGIIDPWDDEPVSLEATVDLAREGVEDFYVRGSLSLTIEGVLYHWKKQFITGRELRRLANLSAHDEVVLLLQKPYDDEVIGNEVKVNLARPGIEYFKVRKKDEDIFVTIRINDKPFSVKRGPHSVSELKKIAGISLADELSELLKGKLVPLNDHTVVHLKGGEEFFSCKREGCSS